jgi:hypothetical protein
VHNNGSQTDEAEQKMHLDWRAGGIRPDPVADRGDTMWQGNELGPVNTIGMVATGADFSEFQERGATHTGCLLVFNCVS